MTCDLMTMGDVLCLVLVLVVYVCVCICECVWRFQATPTAWLKLFSVSLNLQGNPGASVALSLVFLPTITVLFYSLCLFTLRE